MQKVSNYEPFSALVVYQSKKSDQEFYVESFEFNDKGFPINPHPLTENEAEELSRNLRPDSSEEAFLKPSGLLSENVLHINVSGNGSVVWYTPAQKRNLLYVDSLKMKDGLVSVPAMVWKADRTNLYVFSLTDDKRPTLGTSLFKAPFFNISYEGKVCLGTVDVKIEENYSLEKFITDWESCFFESRFSHAGDTTPTKTNFLALWRKLKKTGEKFPVEELVKSTVSLKSLIK